MSLLLSCRNVYLEAYLCKAQTPLLQFNLFWICCATNRQLKRPLLTFDQHTGTANTPIYMADFMNKEDDLDAALL